MSQNIRATPCSSGRQGRIANVSASGIAIMSDSSIALKPVIDEPSKPMPPSKASSSSAALMENDFSWPRMSVNHSRMNRMPLARTYSRISSLVPGCSSGDMRAEPRGPDVLPSLARWRKFSRSEPAQRPLAQLAHGGGELAPHVGERVLDPGGRALVHLALDDAARLQLLHPLREEPVGQVRHRAADLGEAHGATLHQHVDD